MPLAASELILNADGSVYHLNLLPEDIADTIIVVGDPDRVAAVSGHFDQIDVKKRKREFITHTGWYKSKRFTVISTGIGTDNIDIALNELDALVNIDLTTRTVKLELKSLKLIRIGTSGAIQEDIPVDSFLLSEKGIGLDGLMHFYRKASDRSAFELALSQHLNWKTDHVEPYTYDADESLLQKLGSNRILVGSTLTNTGFYAPQGRKLRLNTVLDNFHEKLRSFRYDGHRITNMEMETAAIYGLSALLGHKAISMNVILANRVTGAFSTNPKERIQELILYCLTRLIS